MITRPVRRPARGHRPGGLSQPARVVFTCLALLLVPACTPSEPHAPASVAPWTGEELFAFRDPREGLPNEGLSKKQQQQLDEALQAIGARRYDTASRILAGNGKKLPGTLELAAAYAAIASGRRDEAKATLDRLVSRGTPMPAAWEARADLRAASGDALNAIDDYRSALRLLPGDARLKKRIDTVRTSLVAERRAQAEKAIAAGDLVGARKIGLSLIELAPGSPSGFLVLSEAADAGKNVEDAYVWAWKARALDEKSVELTAAVADLAMRTRRYDEAIKLFDILSARDASYRGKAEQARLEFEIENLPDGAGKAARSQRLTRGQVAVLLWHFVPEVRNAPAAAAAEVAVDAVDRADRQALVRAIALGFLTVNPQTHRVGVEVGVTRGELAVILRRLAVFVSRGRPLKGCLEPESPNPAELVECGILVDSTSRTVAGKEAVRAVQRAARTGREGGGR